MTSLDISIRRLNNQLISNHPFQTPGEVVAWMGAMQAQDFPGAKWSIGLRLPVATERDIENAIAERNIIRTWPMRGTLHFIAAKDARWMLSLLAPRVIANSAGRYKQLELDEKVFSKTKELLISALQDGKKLTRHELFKVFESAKIPAGNQRGIHILQRHAMEALICFGPHEGKQPTFVLLDEWIPKTSDLLQDEALAALAIRYFTSHGPATLKDFIWWTGLITSSAREAIELVKSRLTQIKTDDQVYWYNPEVQFPQPLSSSAFLLPGFDEYVLGYTNRSAIIGNKDMIKLTPGGGMFYPAFLLDGKIAGTWKRTIEKKKIDIAINPFIKLTADQQKVIGPAKERYLKYLAQQTPELATGI